MSGNRTAVARLLHEERERAGYSRARLGGLLGISPGTIEGWELGRVERPPLHDVIRVAEFLQIPFDDLLAAATADTGGVPSWREHPSSAAPKMKRKKTLEAARLLEAAFRLFRWKGDVEAAEALNARPDQVRRWRRGAEPMSVVDYMSLTAIVNLGIADAMRAGDASTFDLAGATKSLGLRIAEA
jgi:transcriptional regulator with XRE-family HTH domain